MFFICVCMFLLTEFVVRGHPFVGFPVCFFCVGAPIFFRSYGFLAFYVFVPITFMCFLRLNPMFDPEYVFRAGILSADAPGRSGWLVIIALAIWGTFTGGSMKC